MYQLFYDGNEPPRLPNLPKRKSAEDIVWAAQEGTGGILNRLRRALAKAEEKDRKLVMYMAQKMAGPKSDRVGQSN